MIHSLLADLTVLVHGAFVVFVVLGGVLVLWNLRWAWVHLPAAAWGAWVEFAGQMCPLTPLENHLRSLAGEHGYTGGFIEHYLIPLMYPVGLTRDTQFVLGLIVVAINLIAYGFAIRRALRSRAGASAA
ncbi:MAG TPA: DUF2784 domain-containing protein [Steroidobacteraceae bacterium]|nr:DUF2784 domain-containing protein [Steroidobacteraceae bacterium]